MLRRKVSKRVSRGFIEVIKKEGNLAELKESNSKKTIFKTMFVK